MSAALAELAPAAPGQGGVLLWRGRHSECARCGCGRPFIRPVGARDEKACLGCISVRALAAAGFTADHPEIRQWLAWNAQVMAAAGHMPQQPQMAVISR